MIRGRLFCLSSTPMTLARWDRAPYSVPSRQGSSFGPKLNGPNFVNLHERPWGGDSYGFSADYANPSDGGFEEPLPRLYPISTLDAPKGLVENCSLRDIAFRSIHGNSKALSVKGGLLIHRRSVEMQGEGTARFLRHQCQINRGKKKLFRHA